MRHHSSTLSALHEEDNSPVAIADPASHDLITEPLAGSGIAVVTEEGGDLHLAAERYPLVDPRDSTKDFLARNVQHTVNIARVNEQRPVLGVVFAPAVHTTYVGVEGISAWRARDGLESALSVHARSVSPRMAVSRLHDHPDVGIFAARNRITRRTAIGSALKYGVRADGEGEVLLRLVGNSGWDTAAVQAVIEAVGGPGLVRHARKAPWCGALRWRNLRHLALRAPYHRIAFQLEEYEREFL
jgi:3'(2'), 5'-bisphosphate nucleotidase